MIQRYWNKFVAILAIVSIAYGVPSIALVPVAEAAIANVSVTASSTYVSAVSGYTFSFDTNVGTLTNNISVIFPEGYTINSGSLSSLGDVTDVICGLDCTFDGYVSVGSGESEALLPVASVIQIAPGTVKISLNSPADLSADTVTFTLKQGIVNPASYGTYPVGIKTGTDTTPSTDNVLIYGDPDNINSIVITPSATTTTADGTITFTAAAYDSGSNLIGDVTDETTFDLYDDWDWWDGGSFTDNVYYPDHTGNWTLEGCYSFAESTYCDTQSVTVTHGVAADMMIMDSTGGNADDYIDTSFYAGDGNTFYSNLVDQHGNYVENVEVVWTISSLDGGVTLSNFTPSATTSSSTSISFDSTAVGDATLSANYNEGEYTDSIGIDVYVWDCEEWGDCDDYTDYIVISPASDTITSNETSAFTVEAFDQYDNSLGDVTGDASFSISEGAGGSFENGVYTASSTGSFTVTAYFAGEQDSASLTVNPGPLSYLTVTPSTYTPTTDDTFTVTLTAYDARHNIKTDYTGNQSVTWSWNAGGNAAPDTTLATLPANGNQDFSAGEVEDIAGFYLPKTEIARIAASVAGASGTSTEITVAPGALENFVVAVSDATPTTDDTFTVTLTARDDYNNVKTDYTGSHAVTWTYDGPASATSPAGNNAEKPADGGQNFSDGVASEISDFRLTTVGTSTISMLADGEGGITNLITVSPGAIDAFDISGVSDPMNAGATSTITVIAHDAEDNVKTDYLGTALFSSTDEDATLPESYTFIEGDAGEKVFTDSVVLVTAGEHEVAVEDSLDSDTESAQTDITVRHAGPHYFELISSTYSPTAGVPFDLTVNVLDVYDNIIDDSNGATPYTGRIALSTDATGSYSLIPSPYTFQSEDAGSKMISVTLVNVETDRTITADDLDTDTTGSVSGISVSAPGDLSVTDIDVEQSYATPGGGFSEGFRWIFGITVPAHETLVQLKFGDFTSGDSTIPAASNIRYYSDQSVDHDDEDPVTVSNNNYAEGMLINEDLDEGTPGLQIEVVVEMRVPAETAGGAYSGTYGIKSTEPVM